MLIELICFELRKAVCAFWLFSDGLILLVLGKDGLSVSAGMFLYEAFESHWLLPVVFRECICFLISIHLLSLGYLYIAWEL
jgi:hypothetical protein